MIRKLRNVLFLGLIGGSLLSLTLPASALTATEVDKLLASDGVEVALFGFAVAIDGDTAIIGAWRDNEQGYDSGSAYVFARDASGNWSEQAKLLASDGGAFEAFGFSVDIDGDTVIISTATDYPDGDDIASVYIFTRDALGNWSEQTKLLPADGVENQQFGFSVAIDGDTAIASTNPFFYVDVISAAYIFTRDTFGNWSQQAKLLASDGEIGDGFGTFVGLDGDTAIIAGSCSGSAYIFTRDTIGNWSEQAKLLASDGASGDQRGCPVAIDGNTAIFGAEPPLGDPAAYVFTVDGSGNWSEEAKLLPSDGGVIYLSQRVVALSNNIAVIGAELDNDNGSHSGSAYIFKRDGFGNWSEQAKLLASDGASSDRFGTVAIDSNTVIIGAYGDDDNGLDSGSAYVFQLLEPIQVIIDIKPGKTTNNINPSSKGKIPVTILTTDTFDALAVDPLTVRFGPDEATESHGRWHVQDVDEDGDSDLLFHFNTEETGVVCGDTEATLTGETFGGEPITGSDSIRTVPCH